MSKQSCPHCSRVVAKGLENYCPHCGVSVEEYAAKQAGERLLAKHRRDVAALGPVVRKAESDLTLAEQARVRLLAKFAADAQAIADPAEPEFTAAEKAALAPPRRSRSFITKAGN